MVLSLAVFAFLVAFFCFAGTQPVIGPIVAGFQGLPLWHLWHRIAQHRMVLTTGKMRK